MKTAASIFSLTSTQAHFRRKMIVLRYGVLLAALMAVIGPSIAQEDPDWWKTATLYQIYPRSQKDTDGDGVGDIKGIIESIPHLVDAGVTCVWLSPMYKSPMKDFGYDVADFRAIDPIFGTWEDFQEMARVIRAAGLRLVMDIVPNHSSDEHEWFQKSIAREDPYTDYYVWKPSKGVNENGTQIPPNNWISAFAGSAWEWNEQRQQFYLHQFVVGQPDLNYRNPLVVKEMEDVLRFWLENGVDGFRLDAPPHMIEHPGFLDEPLTNDPDCPPDQFCQLEHIYVMNQPETLDLLRGFRAVVQQYEDETGESKVIMSEPSNVYDVTLSYYGNATHPIMDFPFNFNLIYLINNQSDATEVVAAITKFTDNIPEGTTPNWVIGNHDQFRVGSRLGAEFGVTTNMISLLLPGVAVTYYGEEINMVNTFVSWEDTQDPQGCNAGPEYYQRFSRDPQRTPFQWNDQPFAGFTEGNKTWLPVNENYLTVNLQAQREAIRSPYTIYQSLTYARKWMQAVRKGTLDLRVLSDDVLAFTREASGEQSALAVIANTAYDPVTADLSVFPNIPTKAVVYAASVDSTLTIGSIVDVSNVPLTARGGVVLTYLVA